MIIELKVDDREVRAALKKMLAASENTEPAMATIATKMLGAVEDNFRAEGRPTKWAALKASTLAARAKAGKSGKILQRSSHLARSITQFHSRAAAGVSTNVKYAAAMQFGLKPFHRRLKETTKKPRPAAFKQTQHPGVVARPFMVLTEQNKGDIVEIMRRHLAGGR